MVIRSCSDGVPILFRYCSDVVPVFSNVVPMVFQHCSILVPTFRCCSDFTPILIRLCSNFVPLLFRFCSNVVPSSVRCCPDVAPMLFQVGSDFVSSLFQCSSDVAPMYPQSVGTAGRPALPSGRGELPPPARHCRAPGVAERAGAAGRPAVPRGGGGRVGRRSDVHTHTYIKKNICVSFRRHLQVKIRATSFGAASRAQQVDALRDDTARRAPCRRSEAQPPRRRPQACPTATL